MSLRRRIADYELDLAVKHLLPYRAAAARVPLVSPSKPPMQVANRRRRGHLYVPNVHLLADLLPNQVARCLMGRPLTKQCNITYAEQWSGRLTNGLTSHGSLAEAQQLIDAKYISMYHVIVFAAALRLMGTGPNIHLSLTGSQLLQLRQISIEEI